MLVFPMLRLSWFSDIVSPICGVLGMQGLVPPLSTFLYALLKFDVLPIIFHKQGGGCNAPVSFLPVNGQKTWYLLITWNDSGIKICIQFCKVHLY